MRLSWPQLCGAGAVVAVLAGCSPGPVEIADPAPSGTAAAACRSLMGALPAELDGRTRREPSQPAEYAAAWGDPPVVLRCGVARPAAYRPTSQLFAVNDVDWLPVEAKTSWTFTTMGRVAHVEVTVPKGDAPEVNPLVDLATAIKRHLLAVAP